MLLLTQWTSCRDVFSAGASHYGVADLELLAQDTHKFESRYLDQLIGPYPAEKQTYVERSPIHSLDKITAPVAFFQVHLLLLKYEMFLMMQKLLFDYLADVGMQTIFYQWSFCCFKQVGMSAAALGSTALCN